MFCWWCTALSFVLYGILKGHRWFRDSNKKVIKFRCFPQYLVITTTHRLPVRKVSERSFRAQSWAKWYMSYQIAGACNVNRSLIQSNITKTTSNGNIFRVTGSFIPVNSPHKGQWRGALVSSLICVWINGWVNNREAGDLRRHHGHYDVIVLIRF